MFFSTFCLFLQHFKLIIIAHVTDFLFGPKISQLSAYLDFFAHYRCIVEGTIWQWCHFHGKYNVATIFLLVICWCHFYSEYHVATIFLLVIRRYNFYGSYPLPQFFVSDPLMKFSWEIQRCHNVFVSYPLMLSSWEIQCCHNLFVSYPLMQFLWEIQCCHNFLLVIRWFSSLNFAPLSLALWSVTVIMIKI